MAEEPTPESAVPAKAAAPPWLSGAPSVPVEPSPVGDGVPDVAYELPVVDRLAPTRITLGASPYRQEHVGGSGPPPGVQPPDSQLSGWQPPGVGTARSYDFSKLDLRPEGGGSSSARQPSSENQPEVPVERPDTFADPHSSESRRLPPGAKWAGLCGAGLVIVLLFAVIGYALSGGFGGRDGAAGLDSVGAAVAVSKSVPVTDSCPASERSGTVTGNGPGSTATAIGTVLAFNYSYYVDRSGAKAMAAVAPSSGLAEDRLQSEGIDRLPRGTMHCLVASEVSPGVVAAQLTEMQPEREPIVYKQRIKLERLAGNWALVSISPAG